MRKHHAPCCHAAECGTFVCSFCEHIVGNCLGGYDEMPDYCSECFHVAIEALRAYRRDRRDVEKNSLPASPATTTRTWKCTLVSRATITVEGSDDQVEIRIVEPVPRNPSNDCMHDNVASIRMPAKSFEDFLAVVGVDAKFRLVSTREPL